MHIDAFSWDFVQSSKLEASLEKFIFEKITNDIQNLVEETQKNKYTAVVYKDEAFTTIIDTPEKYSNEIVKYYV